MKHDTPEKQSLLFINRDSIIAGLLLISTLLVYWQVTGFEFINFDDDVYVTSNERVKEGLNLENIRWAFTSTYANFWHPVTWISYMTDYQLFGMNPGMFHFSALLFHLLNTLVLFWVFRLMTEKVWQSAAVAALFALHPLHVESVAWISQRKDLLSTLFWILTMWGYYLYIQKQTILRYILPLLCYVLGLMAKPMLVTLPFVLLLLDFWPLDRCSFNPGKGKNLLTANVGLVREKIPYFLIAAVFSVIAFLAQRSGEAQKAFVSYPLYTRVTNALVSYVIYLKKTVWPFDLTLHYPLHGAPPVWQVILSVLVFGGITVVAVSKAKKIPYFFVGWFWFLGTMVPVIGIVQIGLHAMADRYTYIPLIGIFIIAAWGTPDLFRKWRYRNWGLAGLTIALLCFFMTVTWVQAGYWKNSVTVFSHAIEATTDNYVAHNNLANALVEEEMPEEAVHHYRIAVRLNPGDAQAMNNLGFALAKMGKYDEAVEYYTEALKLFPDYTMARYNLGDALLEKGDMDGFVTHYAKALGLDPHSFYAYKSLGDILFKKDKIQDAITLYRKALELDPDSEETHTNLGISLFREGKLDEAIPHFKKAVAINPDNPKIQVNLKRALAIRNKMKMEAESDEYSK